MMDRDVIEIDRETTERWREKGWYPTEQWAPGTSGMEFRIWKGVTKSGNADGRIGYLETGLGPMKPIGPILVIGSRRK